MQEILYTTREKSSTLDWLYGVGVFLVHNKWIGDCLFPVAKCGTSFELRVMGINHLTIHDQVHCFLNRVNTVSVLLLSRDRCVEEQVKENEKAEKQEHE